MLGEQKNSEWNSYVFAYDLFIKVVNTQVDNPLGRRIYIGMPYNDIVSGRNETPYEHGQWWKKCLT